MQAQFPAITVSGEEPLFDCTCGGAAGVITGRGGACEGGEEDWQPTEQWHSSSAAKSARYARPIGPRGRQVGLRGREEAAGGPGATPPREDSTAQSPEASPRMIVHA